MFYMLLSSPNGRTRFISMLKDYGIGVVFQFHYILLTLFASGTQVLSILRQHEGHRRHHMRLVRMPLWVGMEEQQQFVMDSAEDVLRSLRQ